MPDINDLFPNGLNVEDAIDLLQPVTLYVAGVAVYAVFVFNFYRFLSSRDMFEFDVYRFEQSRHPALRSFAHVCGYILKYLIVFPLFAYFWFAVLTLMLSFLSKNRDMGDTLLIALATVSAIRFSAYYNEDLARDLARVLPFALLAMFLIDASFFNIVESVEMLKGVNDYREAIVYYLLFLIGLEFVLRFGFGFSVWLFTKRPVRTKTSERPKKVNWTPPESDAATSPSADETVIADGASEQRAPAS